MAYRWNPFTGNLDYYSDDALSAKVLVLEREAAETISALKAVYLFTPTTVKHGNYLSRDEATVIGITYNGGNTGSTISILSFGIMEVSFFNFGLNEPLYVGLNGEITNNAPPEGNGHGLTYIGYGLGPGAIYVKVQETKII